jgi:hypothetical protein
MELLDRYLQAVAVYLPKSQREDLLRELSANIAAQMEDKASELGRPLSEAEQASILKLHGHPMLVAGRYRPRQLIGPVIFPLYWLVLKTLVCSMAVVYLVVFFGPLINGTPVSQIVDLISRAPGPIFVFGVVTLVFAVFDFCVTRFRLLERWNSRFEPRLLPPVARPSGAIPRVPSAFGLIVWTSFTLWWLTIRYFPFLLLGPAATHLQLTDVWQVAYGPVLVLGLAGMARQWLIMVRPLWVWPQELLGLIACATGLIVSWYFLQRAPFVTWRDEEAWRNYRSAADIANTIIFSWLLFISLPCFILVGAVHALRCLVLIFEWSRSNVRKRWA